jgi:hypothetical protein
MRNIMKYDYGQTVLCKLATETGIVMTRPGTVVSITSVDTAEQAEAFGYPLGTMVYTVEFGDGSDRSVSEGELDDFHG